jgi:hypothetical protein
MGKKGCQYRKYFIGVQNEKQLDAINTIKASRLASPPKALTLRQGPASDSWLTVWKKQTHTGFEQHLRGS